MCERGGMEGFGGREEGRCEGYDTRRMQAVPGKNHEFKGELTR